MASARDSPSANRTAKTPATASPAHTVPTGDTLGGGMLNAELLVRHTVDSAPRVTIRIRALTRFNSCRRSNEDLINWESLTLESSLNSTSFTMTTVIGEWPHGNSSLNGE